MKTSRNDGNQKTVELPHLRQVQNQTKIAATLLSALQKIWRFFLIDFAPKNELQVRWEIDRFGHTGWTVYDPVTGKAARFSSEAKMLQWIEDYYSG